MRRAETERTNHIVKNCIITPDGTEFLYSIFAGGVAHIMSTRLENGSWSDPREYCSLFKPGNRIRAVPSAGAGRDDDNQGSARDLIFKD